jgi:hypothetical protein
MSYIVIRNTSGCLALSVYRASMELPFQADPHFYSFYQAMSYLYGIFLVQFITAQIFLVENSVVKVCYVVCLFVCLFVHPFSHTCNTGHINYRLQFMYYNATYNIWTSTQYNVINNNTEFEGQMIVVSVTTNSNTVFHGP